ncbi:Ig-like domain-containing protein [Eudoraea sp.]|uniref:Ig-like domain-containing protein n=1 Tax=Eudoraea sp. TaxID=1979955 RepID=UPI003C761ABC
MFKNNVEILSLRIVGRILLLLFMVMGYLGYSQNIAPTALPDSYTNFINQTLVVDASTGLLANDNDPDGGVLSVNPTVVSGPTSGTLNLNSDGSFTFNPLIGNAADVTFDYQVCDDGIANELVSQFDFDTAALTTATVGPNASSVNPNAVQTACGIRIGTGAGGSAGLDFVIPNTGSIFNFTSFNIEFDYQDNESTADIITAGNFRVYHITGNELGISITVINGITGLSTTYTRTLGNFLGGNITYSIEYQELTGDIIYTANGVTTTLANVAPDYSPLDTSLVVDPVVGRFMDNAGGPDPSLCRVVFIDSSILCDVATATINTLTSVITNRKITYRVNKN